MSYTPTNWQTGDTITAEKLNHMEDGITSLGGYDFVFNESLDGYSADGLSLDEMYEKDALSLRVCRLFGKARTEAYKISVYEDGAMFYFYTGGDEPESIEITEDGIITYFSGQTVNYTYTYSDGHYTIVRST